MRYFKLPAGAEVQVYWISSNCWGNLTTSKTTYWREDETTWIDLNLQLWEFPLPRPVYGIKKIRVKGADLIEFRHEHLWRLSISSVKNDEI